MSKKTAEKEGRKSTLAGAASAVLASKAPKNVLGYEKVYHGTNSPAAKSIKQTGLRKSKSGTGVGAADEALGRVSQKDLKGKVFTSTNRMTANNHQPKFGNMAMGDTLKARVPYRGKKRLARDVVFDRMINGQDKHTNYGAAQRLMARGERSNLRIYKHSIPSRFIEGGKGYAGRKQFASAGNMRRYLATGGGKLRFAKGVAQAAGSGAAAMYAIAHGIKARKESKK